ncbi:aminoacetone oxidase family FAD-binding enzyme [Candidatus Uhrbacteria bacterium]|nr:aminoacetone oxidase family FAD-binding enzyme [Candidatus Uhrbacteria bacterium]
MRVGIIGGGAAGLMAAATILETAPEAELFVIERNDGLGKKVIISGGGRCNVTTGIQDVRTVLTKYPRGGKFLSKAMYHFPPADVYAWFEQHGVPLKVEEDLRVFPQSDNGKDIVGVFEKLFRSSRARILLRHAVESVRKEGRGFRIGFKGGETLDVDIVVLTTGGQAYRQTGSAGDGYAFAMSLGHTITKLAASLNAFFTRETWPAEVSGLSFERATIKTKRDKEYSFTGPFLFTHRGVSGPAVFALSSLVAFEQYDTHTPLNITIDLFPDETIDEMMKRMEIAISHAPKKSFLNMCATVVSKSLAEVMLHQLHLPGDVHAGEVSRKNVLRCVQWLKAIPLEVVGRGAGDEFVTAGGVDLSEVDPQTMESKICPGLYFAGEILDVDGYTGGFNLQASWAAGRLAGSSISAKMES